MPYKSTSELPDSVKDNLPEHAQHIYQKAFNSAWEQYADSQDRHDGDTREETAHQVAWAAVKKKYEKDPDSGEWVAKK